jgi:Domain of unknown function (DUF6908)
LREDSGVRTVARIIELFGGLGRLAEHPIRLEVAGFMPLCVECLGTGPRGLPLVSVTHYFEQNGDLLSDPDTAFEVDGECWLPVSYQQDSVALYQEAVTLTGDGVVIDRRLEQELRAFAAAWDRNLLEQGFLAEAERITIKTLH